MTIIGAQEKITVAIMTWPGIITQPHRFGGTEYKLGSREIGHIHGDSMADIPFPKKVRDELVSSGKVEPHHILPDTGWISFYLHTDQDIDQAIVLFKMSYDLALKQKKPHPYQAP